MKVVLILTLLVAAVSAAPEKRLFESIGHIFHEIEDAVVHTFNQAKDSFNSLTSGLNVNFDDVVNQLIPLIDSGTSEAACVSTCTAASASVLGPAAPLASTVCTPVCKAALSKLEEAAG